MQISTMPFHPTAVERDAALERCLSEIAEESHTALEELYRLISAPVYGYALSFLKNSQDAEDVLHDCFVNVYASAKGYSPGGKPMAWIFTITRNLCLLRLREHRRTSDMPPEDWEDYRDRCADFTPDDRLLLTQCMTRLSDEERQIVVLHAAAGFKHREIAEILQLPLPTVLSKYHRALKKLRQYLEKGEEES